MNYQEIADAALKYLKDRQVKINYSREFDNAIKFIKSATIEDKDTILKAYEKLMDECSSERIILRYSLSGFALGHLNPNLVIQDKDLVMCAIKYDPEFYFETKKQATPYKDSEYGPLKFRDTYKRVLPKKYLEDKEVALLLGVGDYPIGRKFKSIPLKLRNNPDFFFEFVKTPNFSSHFYADVDIDFEHHKDRLKKSVMESKSYDLVYAPKWLCEAPDVMRALLINTKNYRVGYSGSKLEDYVNNSVSLDGKEDAYTLAEKKIDVLNDIIKFRDELKIDVVASTKSIQEARVIIQATANLEYQLPIKNQSSTSNIKSGRQKI